MNNDIDFFLYKNFVSKSSSKSCARECQVAGPRPGSPVTGHRVHVTVVLYGLPSSYGRSQPK